MTIEGTSHADFMSGLNPQQIEAVTHGTGPLLVRAGAGSGKTRVITYRIAYLMKTGRAKPWEILGLTFTNKAAEEMKGRIVEFIGAEGRNVTLRTFHSFCSQLLRIEGARLGYGSNFSIYDEKEQRSVVEGVLKSAGFPSDSQAVEKAHDAISMAKNYCAKPSDYITPGHPLERQIDDIADRYEKVLLENNAMDFDNLLLKAIELFRKAPEVLEKTRKRYRFILVDEYQDTNRAQFLLLKLMAGRDGNLMVVGDHDQSIYGWRGADITNILDFKDNFNGARTVELGRNYRSKQSILEVANSLIRYNKGSEEKRLWSELGEGEKPVCYTAMDERDEADFVMEEVERLLREGCRLDDFAVLFRTRAQTRVFEDAFMRRSIPFKVIGLAGFYERKEVKDAISYLRIIVNPADRVAFARVCNVPRRGIGPRSVGEAIRVLDEAGCDTSGILKSDARDEMPKKVIQFLDGIEELRRSMVGAPVGEMIDRVLEKMGYRKYLQDMKEGEGVARLENVNELKSIAVEFAKEYDDETLEGFLARISLLSDTDAADWNEGAVKLLTLHCAKGLEFRAVFIAGLEEGLLPHHSAFGERREMEEERRLCYVGITRAKDRLYLLNAVSRLLYGSVRSNLRSRFVDEIPPEQVDDSNNRSVSEFSAKPAVELPEGDTDLRAGDKVRHSQMGEGMVVSLKGDEVDVAFDGQGIKKFHVDYVRLYKV